MENKKWKITSESITDGSVEIKFTDERAFPFYITRNYGVICGFNGNSHSIPVEGKENLAMQKIVHMSRIFPDYMEEYFSDVDLSSCHSNFERAKLCAQKMVDDIYSEGRCFDLTNEFGEIVFMFWQALPDSIKNDAISSVCQEKELDREVCTIASGVISNSPDGIVVDGSYFGYNDSRSKTFVQLKNGELKIDNNPGGHAIMYANLSKNLGVSPDELMNNIDVEGRLWDLTDEEDIDKIIFSFWTNIVHGRSNIIGMVCDKLGLDYNKAYYTQPHSIEPADADYDDMPDFSDDQSDLDTIHQIHNPEYEPGNKENRIDFEKRKKEQTALFRKHRDEKNQEEKWDDTDSGTEAEWRHDNTMDENKSSKELLLTESQLEYLRKITNKNRID